MTVATFTQPDRTTQSGSAYPASLDGAVSVLARAGVAFAPHEQSTPNMTVRVDAGYLLTDYNLSTVAAQSTGTITAPATNPRIDRVVLHPKTGVVSVVTGVAAASPVPLPVPDGYFPICQISLATSTTSITNSLITDERIGTGAIYAMDQIQTLGYRQALSNYEILTPAVAKNIGLVVGCYKSSSLQVVLAGSADGTDAYILYGTAGASLSLTEAPNPKNISILDMVLSGGTYVGVGSADGTDAYVITSTNASSWTERANPKNFNLNSVDANGAVVAACGANDGVDGYLIRSTDNGSSWAEIANSDLTLRGIHYSSYYSAWIIAGYTDDVNEDSTILRSTDNAASFSSVGSVPDIGPIEHIAELPVTHAILVFRAATVTTSCLYSADGGQTWSSAQLPLAKAIYDVITLDRGILLLSDYYHLYTEDGFVYYLVPNGSSIALQGGAFLSDNSVRKVITCGGATGTNPFIQQSNSIPSVAL